MKRSYRYVDEAETSSASSSCPPPMRESDGFLYDVFLSFRGPDTRKGFTGHLYQALIDKGISTFIDSDGLEKGQKVEELFESIEKSKIFVPIFSVGYANSEWCLKEIAKIVDCKRLIVPIFFDVEPRDVRKQSGPFAAAFTGYHENDIAKRLEMRKWRDALAEAGKVTGYTLAEVNRDEAKLIKLIVKRILSEVNNIRLFISEHPVGIDSRIGELTEMLDVGAPDQVKMVGIYGMGGIGKTTLAKAVYNQIYSHFDACSFISNIREAGKESSKLVSLQAQLLRDVFKYENLNVDSTDRGICIIKQRIKSKKVLLVLDDVDSESQLNVLAGSVDWFCSGSRIIITTRDKKVLITSPRVGQENVYELKELNASQSLELFSWHAFGKKSPHKDFVELSKEVAFTAAGLPLALEIFGSHFFGLKTDKEWRCELKSLKEDQNDDIYKILRVSFDALNKREKEVFLDIACFFVGQISDVVIPMWKYGKLFPDAAIKVLMHKSLINIKNVTGEFEMHDQIRDMGRKIVEDEDHSYPGIHSRLWRKDDILRILKNKRGIENIEAIQLCCEEKDLPCVRAESFAGMSKLRILQLKNVTLEDECGDLPRTLKWLSCNSQLEVLPSIIHLENIVVLDLSWSSISRAWNRPKSGEFMVFDKLKVLNLRECGNLIICPDFRTMQHLEILDFGGCLYMRELHSSIGCLKSLTHLSLRKCESLKELPEGVWQLSSLEMLDLGLCSQITALPSQSGDSMSLDQLMLGELKILHLCYCLNLNICPNFMSMPHLEKLDFEGCEKLTRLHPSIGWLESMTHLNLSWCKSLKELPQKLWLSTSLEELNLSYCDQLTTLPSQLKDPKSLKEPLLHRLKVLDLSYSLNFTICPHFTSMPHLEKLDFQGCENLMELHPSIGCLKSLVRLNLSWCRSLKALPEEILQLTSLQKLDLIDCHRIATFPHIWDSKSSEQSLNTLPESIHSGIRISYAILLLKQPLLGKLKVLRLDCCRNLSRCPNFTSMPDLKKLDLKGCVKMSELHASVGCLKSLTHLNLGGCASLKELPTEVGKLTSLEKLDLGDCFQIKSLPLQLGDLGRLKHLIVDNTSVTTLPESMRHLKQLKYLSLSKCASLREIPEFVFQLLNLEVLKAARCECLALLPNSLGSLKSLMKLDLSWTAIEELPGSIVSLEKLEVLSVNGCRLLKFFPQLPPSLTRLHAKGCQQLVTEDVFSKAEGLPTLLLDDCDELFEDAELDGRKLPNSLKKTIKVQNFAESSDIRSFQSSSLALFLSSRFSETQESSKPASTMDGPRYGNERRPHVEPSTFMHGASYTKEQSSCSEASTGMDRPKPSSGGELSTSMEGLDRRSFVNLPRSWPRLKPSSESKNSTDSFDKTRP